MRRATGSHDGRRHRIVVGFRGNQRVPDDGVPGVLHNVHRHGHHFRQPAWPTGDRIDRVSGHSYQVKKNVFFLIS